ncbi:hypothetical protein [Actomonas aquatica]|uniref:Uncharacterized protein n=1 Tax=Actomonas aquatica TaxID=2866162 RepID=A0ABZ1C3S9_9BACT|nr:hypothetical protein [Opitutus sp. WL0086]WRQ85898.1 hypothetical protein K1X11_013880 [Opitutus sp. WL0086]
MKAIFRRWLRWVNAVTDAWLAPEFVSRTGESPSAAKPTHHFPRVG